MNSALGHGSTGKDKTPLAQVATWITAAAGIFSEIGSSAPAALPRDVAFLCEDAVADAGGLAPMDLESLNHRLRWNVNSARGLRAAGRSRHRSGRQVVIAFSASPVGVTRSVGVPRAA